MSETPTTTGPGQGRLLPPNTYFLDATSREAGRRGLAKARAALDEARTRTAQHRPSADVHASAA